MPLARSIAPVAFALMLPLSGCVVSLNGLSPLNASKTMKKELKVSAAPEVVVDSRNGEISIEPGGDDQVAIEAEARAVDDASLGKIELSATAEGNLVKIGWVTSDDSYNNRQVNLKIKLPKASSLKLTTGAGLIRAKGTQGGLNAKTGAGSIRVEDVKGLLTLDSGAGSIDVKGALGQVNAVSRAGSVDVDGTPIGDSKVESGAGSVTVRLGEDSKVKVDASTGAGSIRNDFGWARSGNVSEKLSGTLGDGSAGTISVRSSAGSVGILKRK